MSHTVAWIGTFQDTTLQQYNQHIILRTLITSSWPRQVHSVLLRNKVLQSSQGQTLACVEKSICSCKPQVSYHCGICRLGGA